MPEVRRLLHALGESEQQQVFRLHWSHFRRQHQATARCLHRQRRARQTPAVSPEGSTPLRILGLAALTDDRWELVRPLLPPPKPATSRSVVDHRLIVEGILWIMGTSSSWRSLPQRFGAWSKVLYYYRQWCENGQWARILQLLQIQVVPVSSSA